jgi:antitoxin VapB
MSLNIKNPKTHKLAQEVSALTGESMSQAITVALEERKAKLQKKKRFERAWKIAEDMAERLNAPGRKTMRIEDLYDEDTGLPK